MSDNRDTKDMKGAPAYSKSSSFLLDGGGAIRSSPLGMGVKVSSGLDIRSKRGSSSHHESTAKSVEIHRDYNKVSNGTKQVWNDDASRAKGRSKNRGRGDRRGRDSFDSKYIRPFSIDDITTENSEVKRQTGPVSHITKKHRKNKKTRGSSPLPAKMNVCYPAQGEGIYGSSNDATSPCSVNAIPDRRGAEKDKTGAGDFGLSTTLGDIHLNSLNIKDDPGFVETYFVDKDCNDVLSGLRNPQPRSHSPRRDPSLQYLLGTKWTDTKYGGSDKTVLGEEPMFWNGDKAPNQEDPPIVDIPPIRGIPHRRKGHVSLREYMDLKDEVEERAADVYGDVSKVSNIRRNTSITRDESFEPLLSLEALSDRTARQLFSERIGYDGFQPSNKFKDHNSRREQRHKKEQGHSHKGYSSRNSVNGGSHSSVTKERRYASSNPVVSRMTKKRPSVSRYGVVHVEVTTAYASGEVSKDVHEEASVGGMRPTEVSSRILGQGGASKDDHQRSYASITRGSLGDMFGEVKPTYSDNLSRYGMPSKDGYEVYFAKKAVGNEGHSYPRGKDKSEGQNSSSKVSLSHPPFINESRHQYSHHKDKERSASTRPMQAQSSLRQFHQRHHSDKSEYITNWQLPGDRGSSERDPFSVFEWILRGPNAHRGSSQAFHGGGYVDRSASYDKFGGHTTPDPHAIAGRRDDRRISGVLGDRTF